MKTYSKPEVEVLEISSQTVVTASDGDITFGDTEPF